MGILSQQLYYLYFLCMSVLFYFVEFIVYRVFIMIGSTKLLHLNTLSFAMITLYPILNRRFVNMVLYR